MALSGAMTKDVTRFFALCGSLKTSKLHAPHFLQSSHECTTPFTCRRGISIMRLTRDVLMFFVFAVCMAGFAWAAPPAASFSGDRTLAGDKVCTECHDESDKAPVLGLY